MGWVVYSVMVCLFFYTKHTYGDSISFPKKHIDHNRIRQFTPECSPEHNDFPCPPGTLKPGVKRTGLSFLQHHMVEHYKDYDPTTGIIEQHQRFPTAADYQNGAHIYAGRKSQADYLPYGSSAINPPNVTNCFCGNRAGSAQFNDLNKQDKIVGGNNYYAHKYPYLVSMIYAEEGNHFCGGSLLNSLYVLTAAHCVAGLMHDDFVIRLGAHSLDTYPNNLEPEEQVKNVAYIITHFRFNPITGNTDISLIKMDSEVQYNRYVAPVCLPPSRNWVSEGQDVVVAGWGVDDVSSDQSTNLPNEAILKAMSRETCVQNSEYPASMIKYRNICAAAPGKDSCQGDSGGPLLGKLEDGRDCLLGIVSWGIGCNNDRFPGVYTKVQAKHMIQFIFVHTEDAVYCV